MKKQRLKDIIYKEWFVSPFYFHHWDSELMVGRNQFMYKLLISKKMLVVKSIWPVLGFGMISHFIEKREIILPLNKIDSIKNQNNTLVFEFMESGVKKMYGIYSANADKIINLIKRQL